MRSGNKKNVASTNPPKRDVQVEVEEQQGHLNEDEELKRIMELSKADY
jgi:hypothetical protein